jgi:hypothetical protein
MFRPLAPYARRFRATFGLWLATAPLSVLGQAPANRYEALQHALGLSDSQMQQLEQRSPAARRAVDGSNFRAPNGDTHRDRILDDSQEAKLRVIAKVLDDWKAASFSVVLGLMSAQQWPGQSLCYEPIGFYASEFGFSDAQVWKLEQLREAAREPLFAQIKEASRQLELLNAGDGNSPAANQLRSELSKLHDRVAEIGPPRDLTLAILDDAQKAKLAVFETAVRLAREAMDLGLIPVVLKGEVLCA